MLDHLFVGALPHRPGQTLTTCFVKRA